MRCGWKRELKELLPQNQTNGSFRSHHMLITSTIYARYYNKIHKYVLCTNKHTSWPSSSNILFYTCTYKLTFSSSNVIKIIFGYRFWLKMTSRDLSRGCRHFQIQRTNCCGVQPVEAKWVVNVVMSIRLQEKIVLHALWYQWYCQESIRVIIREGSYSSKPNHLSFLPVGLMW
jgi:hypothetical protein